MLCDMKNKRRDYKTNLHLIGDDLIFDIGKKDHYQNTRDDEIYQSLNNQKGRGEKCCLLSDIIEG